MRFLKKAAVVLAVLVAADYAYFIPRHGGYIGRLTQGLLAGQEQKDIDFQLAQIRSALSLYYGDTNGRYPAELAELWKDKKYLPGPPRHAGVYAGSKRVHWWKDTATVKDFVSAAAADDAGGWGYVSDPSSAEYGSVFVNCTHPHWMKSKPWNLVSSGLAERAAAIEASAPPKPAAAPVARATPAAPPGDQPPSVVITANAIGSELRVTVTAEDDQGVTDVWWWGDKTGDPGLDSAHWAKCVPAAKLCRREWTIKTRLHGEARFSANARDAMYGKGPGHQASDRGPSFGVAEFP